MALKTVPPEIFELSSLEALFLGDNQLTYVPPKIGQLGALRRVSFSDNQLTTLPSEFSQLQSLEYLNLTGNKLAVIPAEICQLQSLQQLYLQGNRLTALPREFGQLRRLRQLDLQNNRLWELPIEIGRLQALRKLFLHGNAGLGIPAEVLGPSATDAKYNEKQVSAPRNILDYYFHSREAARPLNEAKLILVGRGGVGKTTLVRRLMTGEFIHPKKTDGIRIEKWKLPIGSEQIQLNVWDFGGQEIMHSTHRCFLTERTLYLLVLSGREGREDEDAEYWLKMIQSFGGGSPIVVVLNKQAEHPFDLNRGALSQKYPAIQAIVRTDCEDGRGVQELLNHIRHETDALEGLRAKFPEQWFRIKDRLSGMKENFLTMAEFRGICARLGEKDSEAQDRLAGHLNNLGIALNYAKDVRLRDKHVLNPHWMVDGIYRIINSERLAERGGQLTDADVDEILAERAYPLETHPFLVDLMRKFELCFALSKPGHYLVPDLLPKEQPEEATEFNPERCLNFQYDYGSAPIPEGLLPRFIVRSHKLIIGKKLWRSGVILGFDGATALVRADRGEKKAYVSIRGPEADRLRLLTLIRADFDTIHADFRGLKPRELVPIPLHPEITVPYPDLLAAEKAGLAALPVNVRGIMQMVNVQTLRTSVDSTEKAKRPARVFVSYSHKDEKFREALGEHLSLLQKLHLIRVWHDRQIEPGRPWPDEIRENLENSEIVLLLMSASFIQSEYCWDKERALALDLRTRKDVDVIPVVVRKVNWKSSDLAGLQALPRDGKAVSLHGDRDVAWCEISERIEELARKRLAGQRAEPGLEV